MRYVELLEAPVGELEVHGMDQPGSFPDVDRKLLTNPAHLDKVRRHFEKTPYTFDLYFVNRKATYVGKRGQLNRAWEEAMLRYGGLSSPEKLARIGIRVTPDPQSISVVYLSNANAVNNAIPMTPWIIAHRFGHALTDRRISDEFTALINRLPNSYDVIRLRSGFHYAYGRAVTMRSARTNALLGDFREELIAQYLITGKVTLQAPTDAEAFEVGAIRTAERAVNAHVKALLTACVGHIFVAT